ncbi:MULTISPECIES: hypothetical protein [unclassified Staphylococcus]|uniref:hypothetical protein n=1 Tax=unclassified Staphylococcus TaxID=91994 RepID=UPI0021D1008A|nr:MULTISPECIES: hypothetical protein [unclassified Staphylococcus]UXR68901.1 hypothetical protein MUA26_06880 [Staphylococcus sp. IVB6246]UXR70958.1 hypothetical protein MUA88_06965 [Staphylococcus sp. IVB6240]UXR73187.1 hypothetical protein MUA48_07140 [Staphylococcus sp. IVB6238]UXR75484.1 hypothetical protein MUA74_07195 [Staphylococcus sp. IVB6233]UXR79686.1 hypothetical protein MUA65_06800 [Staphylococcus sp. IVB6218]
MEHKIYKYKVEKQLWYLNRKEKSKLAELLSEEHIADIQNKFKTPGRFASFYLKEHVFKDKVVDSSHLFMTLLGLFITNILLLGVLITGMLLSLNAANYFINPQVSLSTLTVIAALLGGVLLMVGAIVMMKVANAFFTKRLVEYKYNKVN